MIAIDETRPTGSTGKSLTETAAVTGRTVLVAWGVLTGPAICAQEAFQMRELEASRVLVASGGYFPCLELLKNGNLLVAVKTGAAHIGKTGRADLVRSQDGGRTWVQPVTLFDLPERDDAVDLMSRLSDGILIIGIVSYTWTGRRAID